MFWKNKTVFITGATGFIGSWLALRLAERGAFVVYLDYDDKKRSVLRETTHSDCFIKYHGSLLDQQVVNTIFSNHLFDVVFHLAAQTQVQDALKNPEDTFEVNIRGTYQLMEVCRKRQKNLQAIVLASTDKVYGSQKDYVYHERAPLLAKFPYDVSKACAEMIGLSYAFTYQMPVVATRCANVYGGGDFNMQRLIPYIISSFFHHQTPLLRSNGLSIRDYVFVEDVVEGYLTLAENVQKKTLYGEVYNFGGGQKKTVHEVIHAIAALMKKNHYRLDYSDQSYQEISCQALNYEKATEILGWKPHFSFDLGLETTIEWYEEDFYTRSKTCLPTPLQEPLVL